MRKGFIVGIALIALLGVLPADKNPVCARDYPPCKYC
jgi:hypothetical protein